MGRAIDADDLMKAMYHRAFETDGDTMWQSGCWVRYRAIEQVVKEQPTIELEQKKGRWIKISPANIYECSECGQNVMTQDIIVYRHCHGCGADMREGEQNDS